MTTKQWANNEIDTKYPKTKKKKQRLRYLFIYCGLGYNFNSEWIIFQNI